MRWWLLVLGALWWAAWTAALAAPANALEPVGLDRIVVVGHSLANGRHTDSYWPELLRAEVDASVFNLAVGGSVAAAWKTQPLTQWTRPAAPYVRDFCFFHLGHNDVWIWGLPLSAAVDVAQTALAADCERRVLLVGPTYDALTAELADWLDVACAWVPAFECLDLRGARAEYFGPDGVHFSEAGQAWVAAEVLALIRGW